MFPFLVVFRTSIDFSGDYTSKMDMFVNESFSFTNCRFMNIKNITSSSPLYLYNGYKSSKVIMQECFFFNCSANQGGAFSFAGNYSVYISKLCTVNNSANTGAGDFYIDVTSPYKIDYVSSYRSVCGRSNMYLFNEVNLKNLNASFDDANGKNVHALWAYGILYVQSNENTFQYSYCIFSNCTSVCSISYHKNCNVDYTIHHCMYYDNEIWYWGFFYSERCRNKAVGHVSDVSIINNKMNGQPFFTGQEAIISLESNVYIDDWLVWLDITTNGLVSKTKVPMEIYPMYQTAYCYAIIEPTEEPIPRTPDATIPPKTPDATIAPRTLDSTPVDTPTATISMSPTITPSESNSSSVPEPTKSPSISYAPTTESSGSGGDGQGGGNANKEKTRNLIIIIVAAALGFLTILAAIIYLIRRNKDDNSSETQYSVEMETAVMTHDMTMGVSQNNPLFTTSVTEEDIDPFKNDFEEDPVVDFFDI